MGSIKTSPQQTLTRKLKVLRLDSSSRQAGQSVTRTMAEYFLQQLRDHGLDTDIRERDLNQQPLPFPDAAWVNANFTPNGQRDAQQQQVLRLSDQLTQELIEADYIMIGAPVYNFSVPAALKAWVDLVARVGVTFRYTENGPVGLLTNKKAFVFMASGGTTFGSDIDFASGYLRHILGFIGITDVELITAEKIVSRTDDQFRMTQQLIATSVQTLAAQSPQFA